VRPRNNLFPVRAKYPGGDTLNIGLNYLSADEPQWFTLADVLASKVLTGRTPEVIKAVRFRPKGTQKGLKPIDIAGHTISPATDDSYQRLIIHRNAIKAKLETASAPDKPGLKSDEQAIKILANATSYGPEGKIVTAGDVAWLTRGDSAEASEMEIRATETIAGSTPCRSSIA
jgi:hypothetical protein